MQAIAAAFREDFIRPVPLTPLSGDGDEFFDAVSSPLSQRASKQFTAIQQHSAFIHHDAAAAAATPPAAYTGSRTASAAGGRMLEQRRSSVSELLHRS